MRRLPLLAVCAMSLLLVGAQEKDKGWSEPHTPTRLDWYAIWLNQLAGADLNLQGVIVLPVQPNKIVVCHSAKSKDSKKELAVLQFKDFIRAWGDQAPYKLVVEEADTDGRIADFAKLLIPK